MILKIYGKIRILRYLNQDLIMISFVFLAVNVLAQCDPGYYFDITRGDCSPCNEACIECTSIESDTSTNCIVCSNPMEVPDNDGNCYYPCEFIDNCDICGVECKICNPTKCDECFSPYLALFPGCVLSCPSGYFSNGIQCNQCELSCSECTGSTNLDCISCSTGYISYQGACIQPICGDGIITSPEECDDALDTNCYGCKQIICSVGTYQSNGQCLVCDSSCIDCIEGSSSDCITCSANYFSHNGKCLPIVCGDLIIAGTEQCDDLTNSCVDCKLVLCTPTELLSAKYSNDFASIYLIFDQNVLCHDCSVFQNNYLFGTLPLCTCSGMEITIDLGLNPKLNHFDYIKIYDNTITMCNDKMSFKVEGSDLDFYAKIIVNDFLRPCEKALSVKTEIQPLRGRELLSLIWEIFPFYEEIFGYLNGTSASIPTDMIAGKNFTIKVVANNFLGNLATDEVFIDGSIKNAPVIHDILVREINSQYDVFIRADGEMCDKNADIKFDWEIFAEKKFRAEKFGRILKIDTGELDAGDKIGVRVWAWTEDSEKVYKDFQVKYIPSDLEAIISPRCVHSSNSSLYFTSSSSLYSLKPNTFQTFWSLYSSTNLLFSSNLSDIYISNLISGVYTLNLNIKKFGIQSSDTIPIVIGQENYSFNISSHNKYPEKSIYCQKTDQKVSWSTNMQTKSDLNSNFIRLSQENGLSNMWIDLNNQCYEEIYNIKTPKTGNFDVYPKQGIAYKTLFVLKAGSWENAYMYQYFYSVGKEYLPLTDKVFNKQLTTYLPFGQNLDVKIRVYGISGGYSEKSVIVDIQPNDEGLESVYSTVFGDIPKSYYEKKLQGIMIVLPLLDTEINLNYYKIRTDANDTEVKLLQSKIFSLSLSASIDLPNNKYLDTMFVSILSTLYSQPSFLNIDNIKSSILILRKRINSYLSLTTKKQSISILSQALKTFSQDPSHAFYYNSTLQILLNIGKSIGDTLADEPPEYIVTPYLSFQSGHISHDPNAQNSPIIVPSQTSLYKIFSENSFTFIILNIFSNTSITLIQLYPNINITAYVSIPNASEKLSYICNYHNNVTTPAIYDNYQYWCPVTSSTIIFLSQIQADNSFSSCQGSVDFDLYSFLTIFFLFILSFFWVLWGHYKDKHDMSIWPSDYIPLSSNFAKSLKHCHSFLGIFFRYNSNLSRVSRICIVNLKIMTIILIVIINQMYFCRIFNIYTIAILSSFISFGIGRIFQVLFRQFIKDVSKVEPEMPNYRNSPAIKIPAKVRYSHVRNASEENGLDNTVGYNEGPPKVKVVKKFVGSFLGFCIVGFTVKVVVTSEYFWWKAAGVGIAVDFGFLQVLSIAVQYFVMRKFGLLRKYSSRTIKDVTETTTVVVST